MKQFFSIVMVCLLAGCGSDDRPEPERILKIEAFDVGNVGNSSDIRVRFTVANIAGINEFKIVIIPETVSDDFMTRDALILEPESLYTIPVISSESKFSERLPVLLDALGNAVIEEEDYVIRILVTGRGFQQLSAITSNELNLTDQGIYNGFYTGTMIQFAEDIFLYEFAIEGNSAGNTFSGQSLLTQASGLNMWMGTTSLEIQDGIIVAHVINFTGLPSPGRDCDLNPSIGSGSVIADLTLQTRVEDCGQPDFLITVTRTIPE